LKCYGTSGGDSGQNFCDVKNPVEDDDRQAMIKRSECYEEKDVKSKDACDLNKKVYYWRDARVQACYVQAGYTLDKQFCDDYNPESEIDERYACYSLIGLGIKLDREYCEIKWKENIEKKYRCINTVNSDKLKVIQDQCMLDFD
jgi:hypothetical protein